MESTLMLTGRNTVEIHGHIEDLHFDGDRQQVKFDAMFLGGEHLLGTFNSDECTYMSVDDYNFVTVQQSDGTKLTFCVVSTTWDHDMDDFPFVTPIYQ